LEQYYRDVRIHPIHEGTTGIQGMDLLGLKVMMQDGRAFELYLEEIKHTLKKPPATTHSQLMRKSCPRPADFLRR
jgi:hypothetical protein